MDYEPNPCPECGANRILGRCRECEDREREPREPDYNAPSGRERHIAAWEEKRRLS